ncbi:hypothetical protein LTR84_007130 [Exophiala bonariae]|uniref:FAD/NAD(P)-binding domain-containing protein n=1 Tax=Exophiala bonariae TaxID=1690606 RepID=A0AAV9MYR6_9EURO|nr:hypothetical protein LTR84_007130 [Exophiala bonariae]
MVSSKSDGFMPVNSNTPTGSDPQTTSRNIHIALNNVSAWTPERRLDVVTVGAGFSGLIFAHKLQHQYPDMQDMCDVPAHIYAFPFDPKTDWSHYYATGPQIYEYMKTTTRKWELDRDIKFNHKVIEAVWQEQLGKWKITIENENQTIVEFADILISGQGVLDKWKWPQINNFEQFQGHKCHSANWDHEYDYSNRTVAVIGNGSSGVQIIPQLAKLPNTKVISFQRSPNFVYTPFTPAALLGRSDPSSNPAYSDDDQKRFAEQPNAHREYRKKIIHFINSGFTRYVKGSPLNLEASKAAKAQMEETLRHDPELCTKLIPEWSLGCRRITPGEGYLESFLRPNVQLVMSPVAEMTNTSCIAADGRTFEVDVVVCATGFDVSNKPQWRMIGRNEVDLGKMWEVDPESYLSICARDMPNYFMFLGPNAVVAHGSIIEAINWTGDYIIKWIRKIASENIKSIVPRASGVDELIAYGDQIHKTMVWTDTCKSWFKRNTINGRVTAAFAGSALVFKKLLSEIRGEDFEIEYWRDNRWAFLGNGFTNFELDHGNDLAWYIEK